MECGATVHASSRVLETFFLGVWFGCHASVYCMLRQVAAGRPLSPESSVGLVTMWRCISCPNDCSAEVTQNCLDHFRNGHWFPSKKMCPAGPSSPSLTHEHCQQVTFRVWRRPGAPVAWERVLQGNVLGLAESQLNPLVPTAALRKLDVSQDFVSSSISCLECASSCALVRLVSQVLCPRGWLLESGLSFHSCPTSEPSFSSG